MPSKRERIETMLQERPGDAFLNYSLAMEHLSDTESPVDEMAAIGSLERVLEADAGYVPAYLQLGMLHSRRDDAAQSRQVLEAGIAVAQQANDTHAISEMQAVLDSLPD